MITLDDLQGHWRRDWIKAPGFEDTTTRVNWLQADTLFADLRIPLERPDITGLTCLAEMAPAGVRLLMTAEGFAGQITVAENRCTWHRNINLHGVPAQSDIGLMSFDKAGGLIEDGVLAKYRELWKSVPQAPLRAARISCDGMTGVLIENEDVFLLAIGPKPSGTTESLIAALENGTAEAADLEQHFTSAYVLGRWDGARGIANLSTNPFDEGQMAVERGDAFVWYSFGFDGQQTARQLTIY